MKQLKCFKCREELVTEEFGEATAFVCIDCELIIHGMRGHAHPNIYHQNLKQLDKQIRDIFDNLNSGIRGPYYKYAGRYVTAGQKLQALKNKVQQSQINAGIYPGFTPIKKPRRRSRLKRKTTKYCSCTPRKRKRVARSKRKVKAAVSKV